MRARAALSKGLSGFTVKYSALLSGTQKNRNISRKDAKHVLSNVEGAAKKKK
jgi:hypothetical protein